MIETERLRLRAYTHADAPRLVEILSDERVYPWLDDPPYDPVATVERAVTTIEAYLSAAEQDPFDQRWAIEVRESGVVAGTVLVSPLSRKDGGHVGEHEIGWHLAPDCWGHGYAREAAEAVLDWAFEAGLDEIWCDMYPDNAPSARVAEQLGLHVEGVMPDPWYAGEGRIYRMTAEQWAER